VYEGRWDGALRPQPSEVAWLAWVTRDQLDRMLAELTFCPRLAGDPGASLPPLRPIDYGGRRCRGAPDVD
jgi:hypothetical protein